MYVHTWTYIYICIFIYSYLHTYVSVFIYLFDAVVEVLNKMTDTGTITTTTTKAYWVQVANAIVFVVFAFFVCSRFLHCLLCLMFCTFLNLCRCTQQATTRKLILIFFSPVLPSLPFHPYTHCVHYLLIFVSLFTRFSLPFLARSKLVPHAPLAAVELKNALSAAYSYSWVLSGRESA